MPVLRHNHILKKQLSYQFLDSVGMCEVTSRGFHFLSDSQTSSLPPYSPNQYDL